MNPTTVTDLEERWRPLSDQETTNAQALLADAWALLLDRRPNLDDDIDAQRVSTANVVRVVSAMVLRVLRNPDGLRQESIDDYSYSRDALVASGALHATADELTSLTPRPALGRRSSVRLTVYGDA